MPGIEVTVINLKLPSCNDFSKVKCIFSIGTYSQMTSYPFKPLNFPTIDNYTIISISITHTDKTIGGVDVPLTLFQSKKSSTFKLSDSYNTPDRRKQSPNKSRGETPEITIAIKTLNTIEENKHPDKSLEIKLRETQDMLDESYKSRRELQLSIEETTNQLSEMIKTQDTIIKDGLKEKEELLGKLKEAEEKINLFKNKNSEIVSKVQELESITEVVKTTERQVKITEKLANEVSAQNESYIQQQNALTERIKNTNFEFQERISEYQAKVEGLVNDKAILMKNIENLQKENHNLKKENDRLNSELLKAKAENAELQSEILHNSACKYAENELLEKIKTYESTITSLKEELIKSTSNFKEKISKLSNSNSQGLQENKDLINQLSDTEKLLAKKENELARASQENSKLVSDIACMEQHLCMKEDSNQIIDNLTNSVKELRQQNRDQSEKIADQAEKIVDQKGKIAHSVKIIGDLENDLKEKTEEVEVLMSAVVKLQKNREMYVPVQSDPVDTALADYLNMLDEPLPVPFTREDEGIYLFGTKRIFVKLEQGKIIIRVGGGFMQVNEFIDVYTSAEVDKFARQKAEMAQRVRMSLMGKLGEGSGRDSPNKYNACFGIQRRGSNGTRSSLSPANHTNSL